MQCLGYLLTTPASVHTMGHDASCLVVKHQVDSRKGCVTKECSCQATEEAPVPLAAVDAPQSCVDAFIAKSPALQEDTGALGLSTGPSPPQGTWHPGH